jgi:hypothetical protein
MFDFIGDIHGHGLKLEALLRKLGYSKENNVYRHPERMVFFLGDYIDRGPDIPLTLHIVRSMVEAGSAIALMGNHEFNALAYETFVDGKPLRPHTSSNTKQYIETLNQFKDDRGTYNSHLEWFYSLPLFYETENFRAVHACWDDDQINALKIHLSGNKLDKSALLSSFDDKNPLFTPVEISLKGKEISLPAGVDFRDKDGKSRNRVRIKWWNNPVGRSFKEIAMPYIDTIPNTTVQADDQDFGSIYDESQKPVFFGHYWLKGKPMIQESNICCLDFSIAKEGYLACYRFTGEQSLNSDKIVFV